ncbi:MAG: T9SS type A sorting domain-containing protein [Bacteroides sp.]|nr:T9SS type A sorting domain-containing protein [Bacteroides sp.]
MNLLGDYTATLTLKNDLGSDKKEFQVIKVVTDPASIEGVDANGDLRTYTVDDVLFLEVSEDGNYDVTVYNAAGQQVAAKSQFVSGGSFMRLAFGNAPGVYVVKVLANGNAVKSFKVVKN